MQVNDYGRFVFRHGHAHKTNKPKAEEAPSSANTAETSTPNPTAAPAEASSPAPMLTVTEIPAVKPWWINTRTVTQESTEPTPEPIAETSEATGEPSAQTPTQNPTTTKTASGGIIDYIPATTSSAPINVQPSYSGRMHTCSIFINGKAIKVDIPASSNVTSVSEKGFTTQNYAEKTRSITTFDAEGNATTNVVGIESNDTAVPFFPPVTHYFEGIILPYGSFTSIDFGYSLKNIGCGYTLVSS